MPAIKILLPRLKIMEWCSDNQSVKHLFLGQQQMNFGHLLKVHTPISTKKEMKKCLNFHNIEKIPIVNYLARICFHQIKTI